MWLRHYGKLLHHFHSSDLCSPAGLIAFTITANLNEAAGWANEAAYITIQQGTDIPRFFQSKTEFFSYIYILGKKSWTHTQDISLEKWTGRYFTLMLKFDLLKYHIYSNMPGLKKKKKVFSDSCACMDWIPVTDFSNEHSHLAFYLNKNGTLPR